MSNVGRKGAPGSGILILNDSDSVDSVGRIFDLKEERNRHEIQHVNNLRQDFQYNIKIQENCFRKFSEHYQVLKDSCKTNEITDDISNNIQLSALDKWAFWIDTCHSQGFQHQSQDKLLQQLELCFKDLMRKASNVEKCGKMLKMFLR